LPSAGAACACCAAPLAGLPELGSRGAASPALVCPRCDDGWELVEVVIDDVPIDVCPSCSGLWLDSGETAPLLDRGGEGGGRRRARTGVAEEDRVVRYRACPRCRAPMARVNFDRRSDVVVDRCPRHGEWLDAGELGALRHFVQASDELRRRGLELLAEEEAGRQRSAKRWWVARRLRLASPAVLG
jgi:Zn-finger nucleic acid-binding protein